MGHMHKNELDLKTKEPLPLEAQDKRSVIALAPSDYDLWLAGTIEQAASMLRVAPVELFEAGPVTV
jgi:putative SOS response-associated peptidase YedK